MIEAAVTDVVRPPVSANKPHAFLHEVVGERFHPACFGRRLAGKFTPQRDDTITLRGDAGLIRLICVEQRGGQTVTDL